MPVLGISLEVGIAVLLACIGGLGGILGGMAALMGYWNNRELNASRVKREGLDADTAAINYEDKLRRAREDCLRELDIANHWREKVGEPAVLRAQLLEEENAGLRTANAVGKTRYQTLVGALAVIIREVDGRLLAEASSFNEEEA